MVENSTVKVVRCSFRTILHLKDSSSKKEMLKLIFADIKKFEDHIYKKSTCVYIQQNIEVHIQYMDKESVKFILDNVRSHLFTLP